MPKLFDWINSISMTKENLMLSDEDERSYEPFIINKAMSMYPDCVVIVNELNKLGTVNKRLHYDFLRFAVRKKKRFAKWPKSIESEHVKVIQEYYQCSVEQALQYLEVLTNDQVLELTNRMFKGGK